MLGHLGSHCDCGENADYIHAVKNMENMEIIDQKQMEALNIALEKVNKELEEPRKEEMPNNFFQRGERSQKYHDSKEGG
jgi:hypothetical protein